MLSKIVEQLIQVHCRVGSLEIPISSEGISFDVHCRVGSLENCKSMLIL